MCTDKAQTEQAETVRSGLAGGKTTRHARSTNAPLLFCARCGEAMNAEAGPEFCPRCGFRQCVDCSE